MCIPECQSPGATVGTESILPRRHDTEVVLDQGPPRTYTLRVQSKATAFYDHLHRALQEREHSIDQLGWREPAGSGKTSHVHAWFLAKLEERLSPTAKRSLAHEWVSKKGRRRWSRLLAVELAQHSQPHITFGAVSAAVKAQ